MRSQATFAVPTSFTSSSGGGASSPAVPPPSHTFTSVLAHSAAATRGPRHFDVLGRRGGGGTGSQQQQQNVVSKDQAFADHQLQALVRVKGATILRQRLLYMLRKQFEEMFEQEGSPTQAILLAVEELIVSCDNADVENAGYLREFSRKVSITSPPPPQQQPGTTNTTSSAGASTHHNHHHGGTSTQPTGGATAAAGDAPAVSTERMLSLGTPSFLLTSFNGVPLTTGSRFGIAAASSAATSFSASDSEVSSTCDGDEEPGSVNSTTTLAQESRPSQPAVVNPAAAMVVQEEVTVTDDGTAGMSGLKPNDFYAMRVRRVPGSGSVACPKCLHNLADFPSKVYVASCDAATNTAERSESEKDFLIVSLTKAKADAEKKMEDMKKELNAFKKAKYTNQTLAAPAAAAGASNGSFSNSSGGVNAAAGLSGSPNYRASSVDLGPGGANDSFSMTMSPIRAATPALGALTLCAAADGDAPLPPVLRSNTFSGGGGGGGGGGKAGNVLSTSQQGSPSKTLGGGGARRGTPSQMFRRGDSPAPGASSDSSNNNATVGGLSGGCSSGGGPAGGGSDVHAVLRVNLILRVSTTLKELRSKLHAIKTGIRGFQFKEVIHQFSQHVLPQVQQLQAANKRLLDRDYILEKLLLDALCKVGTMPDAGSPEGYLPEGGPLHVGTYSLLDDRRFLEWTRRINDTLSGKVTAVQAYISTLTYDARHNQTAASAGTRKEVVTLEERINLLEGAIVENECFNVSNVLDHTFDSSTAVQGTRRQELVALLKHAAETNEEIRLVYVIPSWASKPQLRVKLNMWRQRRMDALQKIEQLLGQELQHFVSSGAQKIMLKGKLMTLRELIQLGSRLHLMPSVRSGSTSSGGATAASPGSGGGAPPPPPPVASTSGGSSSSATSPPAQVVSSASFSTIPAAAVVSSSSNGGGGDSASTNGERTPPHTPSSKLLLVDPLLSGTTVDSNNGNIAGVASLPGSPNGGRLGAAAGQQQVLSLVSSPSGSTGTTSLTLRDSLRSPPGGGVQSPPTIRRTTSSQLRSLPPVKKE